MWNRRKEEEPMPKITPQPPTNAALAREGIPMNTLPPKHEIESSRTASIGKSCHIKGQLFSREDLYIDGEIEGSVEMQEHRLTVGPNGQIRAGIKAREVVVNGTVHGNVEAGERIEIRKDAKLVGDIRTMRTHRDRRWRLFQGFHRYRPQRSETAGRAPDRARTSPGGGRRRAESVARVRGGCFLSDPN
jgi:cytoskeletal protein CcmA (bactofilin family)